MKIVKTMRRERGKVSNVRDHAAVTDCHAFAQYVRNDRDVVSIKLVTYLMI